MTPFIISFFFNDTATTEIYTLSLHDALPICPTEAAVDVTIWRFPADGPAARVSIGRPVPNTRIYLLDQAGEPVPVGVADRKSTRLNSSHSQISYAVFCLKKKKQTHQVFYLSK